jgi:hypothetical protein
VRVVKNALFFYTGHGQDSGGDLVLDRGPGFPIERISFELFFQILEDPIFEHVNLTVVVDSCYSGCWLAKFRSTPRLHGLKIAIQASCAENELTLSGFIGEWIAFQDAPESGGRDSCPLSFKRCTHKLCARNPIAVRLSSCLYRDFLGPLSRDTTG